MKNKILDFLRRYKILSLFFFVFLLIVAVVFIRARLFLSNECPSCGLFLYFYKPDGYYNPLFKKTLTIKKGETSFSFSIDKYGEYGIGLENLNKSDASFHFSKNIDYSFSCESMKSDVFPGLGLPKRSFFGNKKVFFNESRLLQMDGLNEPDKEGRVKDLFIYHYISLGSVVAFDIGSWGSGGFYDDIGRQYDCTVEFLMDEADFFEADLVVKRTSPH